MLVNDASTNALKIDVPNEVIEDLHRRLDATRWPSDLDNETWSYGAQAKYLRELATYWRHEYDWREREKLMNGFPHFRETIDGIPIHFIHVRGKGPNPIPMLMSHGWPSTFWDFYKVIGPLTDPMSHGGDSDTPSFDVIIPSLPGYGFSSPLEQTGINFWNTADLWVKLMDRLGYDRFVAQGGDWGGFVSAQLAHKYADRLIGAHLGLVVRLDCFTGGMNDPNDYGPEDAELLAENQAFAAAEAAYAMLQATKPQTPAFGMNDSPVGLLAWIIEKFQSWSDCDGDLESRYTKDELLDTVMIYWITQTFGSSVRYYYEAAHNPWRPSHDRMPVVEAPVSALIYHKEMTHAPRKWVERYHNIVRYTEMTEGGHFPQLEVPELLIEDIREAYRSVNRSK